jgi:hypothetical protein
MESLSWIEEVDFAPGDRAARSQDWSGFECHRIHSPEDPNFPTAFQLLWDQFHPAGEMETRETIEARLARRNAADSTAFAAIYEMVLVCHHGQPAAVRDFTVITSPDFAHLKVLVHLSHNLVLPDWRRSGLAAWMRALPMAVALLSGATLPENHPGQRIALASEMEAPNPEVPATLVRLGAYGKAGFRKIDPAVVPFLQPDFRHPALIEQDGENPIPLQLVVRFCPEPAAIDGATVREIVTGLYDMYALEFRAEFMHKVRASLARYPAAEAQVALLDPLWAR